MAAAQDTGAANNPQTGASQRSVARGLLVVLLALMLVPTALADSKRVKPADRAAINKLLEFIDLVQAQSGRHITADAAQILIADAQYVIGTLR